MKIYEGYKLTDEQYNMLSYFATTLFNIEREDTKQQSYIDFDKGKIRGMSAMLCFGGIADEIVYRVQIDKVYKGLRNYNKLSEIQLFNQ